MSLSIEDDYHESCRKVNYVYDTNSETSIIENACKGINENLQKVRFWKQAVDKQNYKKDFRKKLIEKAKWLEECVRRRIKVKIEHGNKADEGHDFVIKIIIFELFFNRIFQAIEDPNNIHEEDVIDCGVDFDQEFHAFDQNTVCGRLFELFEKHCNLASEECPLFQVEAKHEEDLNIILNNIITNFIQDYVQNKDFKLTDLLTEFLSRINISLMDKGKKLPEFSPKNSPKRTTRPKDGR